MRLIHMLILGAAFVAAGLIVGADPVTHAADEAAVSAYFDFAHAFSVAGRIREMAAEMEDVIELVNGDTPSPEAARTFEFPD